MSNKSLVVAKKLSDNDSWFTTYEDVEQELQHYQNQFANKRVLCNADDPIESAFTCYFIRNFHKWKLQSLTCISHIPSRIHSYHFPSWEHLKNVAYAITMTKGGSQIQLLQGDGGFETEEVQVYWENADIVCTNPPFSLFRQFFDHILKYQVSYLVLCNLNAITYKNVFPQVVTGKAKLGYAWGKINFRVPTQQQWNALGNVIWLTDLEVTNPFKLVVSQQYSPELHPQYDNFNAIHVSKLIDIPVDYWGIMGVPITYIRYHDPNQFEFIGKADHGTTEYDLFMPWLNGKRTFKRLLIRKP